MRLLVLVNETSHTGAPVLALHFLEWLRKNHPAEIRIISMLDGGLTGRFRAVGKTMVLGKQRGKIRTYFDFAVREMIPAVPEAVTRIKIHDFLHDFKPELIYVFSVIPLKILSLIPGCHEVPVLCHVTESNMALRYYLGQTGFGPFESLVDVYLAAGVLHLSDLTTTFQVPREKVTVLPHLLNVRTEWPEWESSRRTLGIPEDTFVVLNCGKLSWLKSPELFVMTALEVVKQTRKPVKFIWVGETGTTGFYQPFLGDQYERVEYDIKKAGLQNIIEFTGYRKNLDEYYAACDCFFLSSREDTYALVCLDAAMCGKPLLSFDGIGGIPEFIGNDAGFVIPYLDVRAAAGRILELMEQPELRNRLGQRARERCLETADIRQSGNQLVNLMQTLITEQE